jgi:hypothetical protein
MLRGFSIRLKSNSRAGSLIGSVNFQATIPKRRTVFPCWLGPYAAARVVVSSASGHEEAHAARLNGTDSLRCDHKRRSGILTSQTRQNACEFFTNPVLGRSGSACLSAPTTRRRQQRMHQSQMRLHQKPEIRRHWRFPVVRHICPWGWLL